MKTKTLISTFILSCMAMLVSAVVIFPFSARAVSLSASTRVTVGVTYYGGEYRDGTGWVIDNVNQCQRIAAGEFTAASLGATVDSSCDDDNGLGYMGPPLHNTVSFAELSNDAANPDYAALGNLPSGTKVEISYQGRCVVAEKRDVGQGGGPVNGYPRALDLWWQTARSLNFKNGYDTMSLRLASSSQSLTPLGTSTSCQTPVVPAPTTKTNIPAASGPSASATTPSQTAPDAPVSSTSSAAQKQAEAKKAADTPATTNNTTPNETDTSLASEASASAQSGAGRSAPQLIVYSLIVTSVLAATVFTVQHLMRHHHRAPRRTHHG